MVGIGEQQRTGSGEAQPRTAPAVTTVGMGWLGALLLLATVVVAAWAAPLRLAPLRDWIVTESGRADTQLRWLLAIVPGSIIVNQMVYLLSSRRKQFERALAPADKAAGELADLYFAPGPMLVRYLVPAVLSILLCSAAIAALTNPQAHASWLWAPNDTKAAWPGEWGAEVLRGAALGFVGAYVYVLLSLTDRARRRDITTGLAVWAAAMPVLGPLMGGVAALLIASGAGVSEGSFTRDAVFFVAGMLPQQFAAFVQASVRKMFQTGGTTTLRALPLTVVRGVGPEVEARLQEEGIYDVSALAYASPYQLIRATTYAPKQIADWIDEALLIATLPQHWDVLEKVGVTGSIDLAWYAAEKNRDSIAALASEIKMSPVLLTNVIDRLNLDAQVQDLRKLYWDDEARRAATGGQQHGSSPSELAELRYRFKAGILQDARDRLVANVIAVDGVTEVTPNGDRLTVRMRSGRRDAIAEQLGAMNEIDPES